MSLGFVDILVYIISQLFFFLLVVSFLLSLRVSQQKMLNVDQTVMLVGIDPGYSVQCMCV